MPFPPKTLLKPQALKSGARLAVLSPSGPSSQQDLKQGQTLLTELGYHVQLMPNCSATRAYVAGTPEQRLSDLKAAFEDPTIDGILCARGGYGANALLHGLPYDLIRANPKPLMGFSDVTLLHHALYQRCGLVSFYSPMLTSNLIHPDANAFTLPQWQRMMHKRDDALPVTIANQDPYSCIYPGVAEGPLLGGNLSLLAALCGTPWQPELRGAIVFIEDWKESFYRLDRKLSQLHYAGLLDGIAGLLFCDFSFCEDHASNRSMTAFFEDLSQRLGWRFPVGYGFTIGHGSQTATIPCGVSARFASEPGTLQILESPFA